MTKQPRAGICRHYDYVRPTFPRHTTTLQPNEGPQCALGIALDREGGPLQCLSDASARKVAPCPSRQEWTREEDEAREVDFARQLSDAIDAMALIPREGYSGEFGCPVCTIGRIRWRRAGSRGHLRLACTTPDCVQVIQ